MLCRGLMTRDTIFCEFKLIRVDFCLLLIIGSSGYGISIKIAPEAAKLNSIWSEAKN